MSYRQSATALHALNSLLLQNTTRFDIEYSGFLSNHLSHGLIALYKLGASPSRIHKFYNNYTTSTDFGKLEPMIPAEQGFQVTEDTWKNPELLLGKKTHFTELMHYFSQKYLNQNENETIDHLIAQYYPSLVEGLSGAAFHALIQLGYGLEVMNTTTILEGLAYSVYAFKSLGKINRNPPMPSNSDLLSVLNLVRDNVTVSHIVNHEFPKDLGFQKRMAFIHDHYLALLQSYDVDLQNCDEPALDQLLNNIFIACVKAYASSNDHFFVLHIVTATRSLQLVYERLSTVEHKREAIQYMWKAIIAAYICVDAPELNPEKWTVEDDSKLPAWSTIIEKVMELPAESEYEDEHKIKMVMVCHESHKQNLSNDPLFRLVAARKVGLLPW